MKAYLQLTLSQLRLFTRNRQVLFWTLMFPVFFMIMLGSFFGQGNSLSLSGVLIDRDGTADTHALHQALLDNPVLDLKLGADEDDAKNKLQNGDIQLVIVIPKGAGSRLAMKPEQRLALSSKPPSITLYTDETNQTATQVAGNAVSQIVDAVSKASMQYAPAITVETKGLHTLDLRYIDFLVPGIVAMMIMSNNLNGVSGQIASWRERGILRRMQSTPLHASSFISAQITARLVLNAAQAIIVLLIGNLVFGTQVNGSWALLLMFVILGTLTFMSIGFIIAGLAKTPESVGPIAGFVSFPLMFLGGVFFPIKNMPDFLQPIVKALPISHLSTALRQIMNVGAGWAGTWHEAALLGAWLLVAFIVASFTFKWE
jgi:ABC-2 type transport system permease protein